MPQEPKRISVIEPLYERYLVDQVTSVYAAEVSKRFSNSTLERLVMMSDRMTRRASVLALGMLGDYSSNSTLGKAMIDRDRGVRSIAENSIREVWIRVGDREQREHLAELSRLNQLGKHDEVVSLATSFIRKSPWIAEAWCQRGTAFYHQGQYRASIRDCNQALEINPYHFIAAAGMGQCYIHIEDSLNALEAYRRALRLNPGMEEVRMQVIKLQRRLKEDELN